MSYDERLSKLVRKLNAEHDFLSPHDEAPHMRFSSVPLHWGPEICTFPSLSIVPPPQLLLHQYQQFYPGQQQQQQIQQYHQPILPYDRLDPATKPDQSQHQEYIHLMSQKEKCSQYSIPLASFNMLRNLVLTFRSMLEYQIQHLIHNVMESKQRSILHHHKNHKHNNSEDDQKILDKFTNLTTTSSLSSLVRPETAFTNFSTMLPMEQWQEVGYQNISLRLIFRAEIDVRITPNDTIHKATFKSTGAVVGVFSNSNAISNQIMNNNNNRRPEELDIDINTKALYNSIRRECKVISKKVVNAIVGYELLKLKSKSKKTNSTNLGALKQQQQHQQRHPAPPVAAMMMMGHTKQISMHSDGATYRTEKTTMSSVDGRDPRPTPFYLDESKRDIKSPNVGDVVGGSSSLHDQSSSHHDLSLGSNDLTPKKKTTNSSKFTAASIGKGSANTNTNPNTTSTTTTDIQEVDNKTASASSNFAVIYEQELVDEAAETTKKSKKKKWKRLLSPHKTPKHDLSISSSNNHPTFHTDDDIQQVEAYSVGSSKASKKHEGRWKGIFTSSKQ